jgi:hypothetical protein
MGGAGVPAQARPHGGNEGGEGVPGPDQRADDGWHRPGASRRGRAAHSAGEPGRLTRRPDYCAGF